MSDMPPGLPPFMTSSPGGGPPAMSEGSFAQSMGAFGTLLKVQQNISDRFPKAKIPWDETRKFLKCFTIDSIRSNSLYKFHMKLFNEIGLGSMQLISYAPMNYIFAVPNNPICNCYPALNNQKVCVATTDALHRFFTEEMELECSVEETECTKNGDPVCKFKVALQPI
ncbi:MAG: 4-vinyl reductase, partial [Methanolobus sp.]|nr:4-vinyl reductase [Methanolobus sp.]